MKTFLQNWSLMRIARLAIGLLIMGSSVIYREPLLAVVGGLYVVRILLNIGCGPAGCELPPAPRRARMPEPESTADEKKAV